MLTDTPLDGVAYGDPAFFPVLAGLALLDSLSFGTLLIPLWLLVEPGRVLAGRMLAYLGTVVGAYAALGITMTLGATALAEVIAGLLRTAPAQWAILAVGGLLLVIACTMNTKSDSSSDGRLSRWRRRAVGEDGAGLGPLLGLAVVAVAAELASMLPYLAAIGLVSTQGPGMPASALIVLGYCLVMVAPALVLMTARLLAARAVTPHLERLERWLRRNAGETTAWVVGIVGFLLARSGAAALGLLGLG